MLEPSKLHLGQELLGYLCWCGGSRNCDERLEHDQRSGRPSSIDDDQMSTLVDVIPREALQGLASELKISGKAIAHMRKIGKRKKIDK